MAERTRFGPAGVPPMFRLMGAELAGCSKACYTRRDLDAFEYRGVSVGSKAADKTGKRGAAGRGSASKRREA